MNTFISAAQCATLPRFAPMNAPYIRARLTDALALLRIIQAEQARERDEQRPYEYDCTITLYSLRVLILAGDGEGLTVSWYDLRDHGKLYECSGLTPFLAYVLRRFW